MKNRTLVIFAPLLALCISIAWAQPPRFDPRDDPRHIPRRPEPARNDHLNANSDALVAKVSRVTVLSFDTRRPISAVRILLNGREIANDTIAATDTGIKFAIVRGTDDVTAYYQAPGFSRSLKADYQSTRDTNLRESEAFAEKSLRGGDWTCVYELQQETWRSRPRYVFTIEVR